MCRFTEEYPLVYTVKNRCRVCYTCVRECPAKAIRIINGQAEVITERCIACGNCVKVCSQGAKKFHHSGDAVQGLLSGKQKVVACIAPSFPAEFSEFDDYKVFVGMVKQLGFAPVVEVSFGADLVADKYSEIFSNNQSKPIISSDCPAVVHYVQQYYPELTDALAPIDSPAMAAAKVVKTKYGENIKTVFIGPCTAKKAESDCFDEVLTFSELRLMFQEMNITPENSTPTHFDPPHAGKGAIFPISRGLLHAAGKNEGFGKGEVLVAEGKDSFIEAITEFSNGLIDNQHLELLCCEGCIMGAGMSTQTKRFARRAKVSNYVQEKLKNSNSDQWEKEKKEYAKLNLNRTFEPKDRRKEKPEEQEIQEVLNEMGKDSKTDLLDCGACGYSSCRKHATAVVEGLAETEMCLPFTIKNLNESIGDLNTSNKQLANTKQALIQSEKLASMGQVSAGIAHELNNPLGVISLYSSILKDDTNKDSPLFEDLTIIDEQAQRCKTIVGGLLNFARKNQVNHEICNIADLVNHSFESLIKEDSVKIEVCNNLTVKVAELDKEKMMQVLSNLEKNATEAMPHGGTLSVELSNTELEIIIKISDTGCGIEKENLEKIFTPFFTTKGTDKGTGLGLPLVYGIVKMHKGQINVSSKTAQENEQTGTTFTLKFPIKKNI